MKTPHTVMTDDGWALDVQRHHNATHFDPTLPPMLFIPGYGMNSFILSYHPSGVSMIEYLTAQGHEVWTANLRGQGDAKYTRTSRSKIGFSQLALTDIPCARDHVLAQTETTWESLVFVGCSLGASMLYAYLAHHPKDHKMLAFIAIGGPLIWNKVHPLLKTAFRSPELAALIPFKGTRKLAALALPIVRNVPGVLNLYMNARYIDLSDPHTITQTVDDPVPYLNLQIARWIHNVDLVVNGLNVTTALESVDDVPILCILANRDGIVPPETALAVLDAMPSPSSKVVVAGDDRRWFAHADLFIGETAQSQVFEPMAQWLSDLDHA